MDVVQCAVLNALQNLLIERVGTEVAVKRFEVSDAFEFDERSAVSGNKLEQPDVDTGGLAESFLSPFNHDILSQQYYHFR